MLTKKTQPHILVIMTDQQRYDCLGVTGHPILKTPNIDRIAERGTLFTHAHTTSPLCMPARISLISGQYPHNTHIWENEGRLPSDTETYVKALKRGGYRTCHIGKAHLYYHENTDIKKEEPYMHSLGWDDVFETQGTWSSVKANSIYYDYLKENGLNDVFDDYLIELDKMPDHIRRFIAESSPLPEEHVLDSFIGRKVVQYVKDYQDSRPSFLFVGFAGPHEPWDAPGRFSTMYDPEKCPDPIPEGNTGEWLSMQSREYDHWAQYIQPENPHKYKEIAANYFGKISLIDEWIGRILDAYEEKGWLDNTVIMFLSDHGEMLGDLGRVSKSMFYESAVRVPLIIRLPDQLPKISNALVETIDIYPTLLEIASCESIIKSDGKSLLPILTGSIDKVHDNILSEVHTHTMIRDYKWKLVVGQHGETLQLFNFQDDPYEQTNLAGHPNYRKVELKMRSTLLNRILSTCSRGKRQLEITKKRPKLDYYFNRASNDIK